MAHRIQGFIARLEGFQEAASRLPGASVVPLSLGFGFLPVTDCLAGDEDPAPFEHLEKLTARLAAWAEDLSRSQPVAYVETDYFGGEGWQAAMAWDGGRTVFGPVRTTSLWVDGKFVSTPLPERAINRAVRLLGVQRSGAIDEFKALGLGRHRSNEAWLLAR